MTLNARYQHSSLGLRYIYANLKEFRSCTQILEYTIKQDPKYIVGQILSLQPKIVGFSVYIWNTEQTLKVIRSLKKLAPEIIIVLGGPEVSYETDSQTICQISDHVVIGEGDLLFYEFCKNYLDLGMKPSERKISGPLPELTRLESPYPHYSEEDLRHRTLYVEASRGCPYKCEYCLSSLDVSVRGFDLDDFLAQMDQLIQRGARQFKFVDRTFNLSFQTSSKILGFFLQHIERLNSEGVESGLFLHFEMVPDRLPDELKYLIQKFPRGTLQFEVGIQTWNAEVSRNVSRRQNYEKICANLKFLRQETGVHVHADLIAGLPGETLESFGYGFDQLASLEPQEIQVGLLKRLRGTPITRHDKTHQMIYEEHPPYQILQTQTMDFQTLQRIERFSYFWNLFANSGNFNNTLQIFKDLCNSQGPDSNALVSSSFFSEMLEFTDYLFKRHPQGNGISLLSLVESTWVYLTQEKKLDISRIEQTLTTDYSKNGQREIPSFAKSAKEQKPKEKTVIPERQRAHLNHY